MPYTKSKWKSTTVWFNVGMLAMEILTIPELVGIIPAKYLPYQVLAQSVANILLRRYKTKSKLY